MARPILPPPLDATGVSPAVDEVFPSLNSLARPILPPPLDATGVGDTPSPETKSLEISIAWSVSSCTLTFVPSGSCLASTSGETPYTAV